MASRSRRATGIKYGKDGNLEKLANQLLGEGVGDNKRSLARDAEKMSYESGLISAEELRFYDPENDWDTRDSAFAIFVDPAEISSIEPSICADPDVDDGNVRARNPRSAERQSLSRHVEDDDDWGPTGEDIPLLGINTGPRKTCTKCKRSKGLQYFSPDSRNSDGLHSWCKACRNESEKTAYVRKIEE